MLAKAVTATGDSSEWVQLLALLESWPTDIARNTLARLKAGARHAKTKSHARSREATE